MASSRLCNNESRNKQTETISWREGTGRLGVASHPRRMYEGGRAVHSLLRSSEIWPCHI